MNLICYLLGTILILLTPACKSQKTTTDELSGSTTTESQKLPVVSKKDTYPIKAYTDEHKLGDYALAIFAGGCFWCTEAAFERINGVVDVISGYSGGEEAYPDYYGVGAGKTGHAEAIAIYYDPAVVTYATLLDVFFVAHDPTTLNRQGPDVGAEYRSGIYYQSSDELAIIDKKIKAINASDMYDSKIVTEVAQYQEFWVAEAYHQNYYELHPEHSYVARVSRPKVKKVLKAFPELIKKKYK